jgi:hypothetical protein
MGKGKNRRKKMQIQQRAEEAPTDAAIVEDKIKNQAEAAAKNAKKSINTMEASRWKRIREYFGGSLFTNPVLAAITLSLAWIAYHQFRITDRQLDVMRKDQRPWIQVSFDGQYPLEMQAQPGGILHVANKGKTPATDIDLQARIETVKNGEQPKLSDSAPLSQGFTSGVMFPNDPPKDRSVARMRFPKIDESAFGKYQSIADPITDPLELDKIKNGDIFSWFTAQFRTRTSSGHRT